MDVGGYVLAGGASSRMGRDKGLLPVDGETLIERAMRLVGSVASTVKLVGDHNHLSKFASVVADTYKGCGPLGGIHAALTDTTAEWNVMFAVDQVTASVDLLRYLASRAEAAGKECLVVAPDAGGRLQPLCALYRKCFVALAEEALAIGVASQDARRSASNACEGEGAPATGEAPVELPAGRRRYDESRRYGSYAIVPLYERAHAMIVPETELREAGIVAEVLNVNTPEEFARFLRENDASNVAGVKR
jgi:molybdopterin-guanine dinucleotide biosynthesis protein A